MRIDSAQANGAAIVAADVVSEENRYHHDAQKLAATVMNLHYQRRPVGLLEPQSERLAEPQETAVS